MNTKNESSFSKKPYPIMRRQCTVAIESFTTHTHIRKHIDNEEHNIRSHKKMNYEFMVEREFDLHHRISHGLLLKTSQEYKNYCSEYNKDFPSLDILYSMSDDVYNDYIDNYNLSNNMDFEKIKRKFTPEYISKLNKKATKEDNYYKETKDGFPLMKSSKSYCDLSDIEYNSYTDEWNKEHVPKLEMISDSMEINIDDLLVK